MGDMKALAFERHGTLDQVQLITTSCPAPGPGEVLLAIHAAALNRLDLWVLQGWPNLKLKLPHIMGSDGAGVVVEVGDDVTRFKKGDRVAINPTVCNDPFDHFAEDSVLSIPIGFILEADEELAGCAVFIVSPSSHPHRATNKWLIAEFRSDRRLLRHSPSPEARISVARLGIATLNEHSRNDPMKSQAVIKSFARQLAEMTDVFWGEIRIKLDLDPAKISFNHGKLPTRRA